VDPVEVSEFLDRVAAALESAQNHSAAMEAKARAAVAKIQELSAGSGAATATNAALSADQSDQISRTLLLAQRAADEALATAQREAAQLLEAAELESTELVDRARAEARAVDAVEREQVRSEVEALLARREFLTSDMNHLEGFLVDQRERLRATATTLLDLAQRVPGGLGHLRAPLLSAGTDEVDDEVVDGLDSHPTGPEDQTEAMPKIVPLDHDDGDSNEGALPGRQQTNDGHAATDPGEQLRIETDLAGRADAAPR
jgi:cell division septum initiation protein DivIVA